MWLRHSNQPQSVKESVGIRGGKKTFADWLHKGALLPFTSSTTLPSDVIFHFLFLPDDIIHEMKLCYFL